MGIQVNSGNQLGQDITEDELNLSDNTTANASTAAHGLCPKLSNDDTQFLDGKGSFSSPDFQRLAQADLSGGAAGSLSSGTFTAKKFLIVHVFVPSIDGNSNVHLQLNNISDNRYSQDCCEDDTYGSAVNQLWFTLDSQNAPIPRHYVIFIANNQVGAIKLVSWTGGAYSTAASSSPVGVYGAGNFIVADEQVTQVAVLATPNNNLAANTEIIVFGSD
jgi:hypothetical protein